MLDSERLRIVANIFISFIGAGVLGLPYAFKEAGLMEGSLIMASVCYLSVTAMLLLMDCRAKIQQSPIILASLRNGVAAVSPAEATTVGKKSRYANGKEYVELKTLEEDPPANRAVVRKPITYSDVAFAALGRPGRITVDASLLITQVGFCCAYLIFITENLASFIDGLTQSQWLLIILPPLFLLTLVPDLGNLAIFSVFAQVSNLFAFAVVFWFDFEHFHLASNEHRKEFSIQGFPFFFSVAIYCFEGAGMILSLEQSVSEKMRHTFRSSFVWTIIGVTSLYITFGVSGYLSYGAETKDIITLNLPSGSGVDFAMMVKSCLCFSLFFTYPIMMFPVNALLEERCQHLLTSKLITATLIRVLLVSSTGFIVIVVPRFADLMALVGASCCTILAFILPGTCHMILFASSLSKRDHVMDYVLIVTGVIGAVIGTLDALANITS